MDALLLSPNFMMALLSPCKEHWAAVVLLLVSIAFASTAPKSDPAGRNTGGWPELRSRLASADSDHDGMPDDWKKENMASTQIVPPMVRKI